MQKIRLYIGSNNDTKILEREKIEQVLATHYESFSEFEIVGYWKGEKEKTLMVEIISEEPVSKHAKVAKELAKACEQQAVMLEITEVNASFIS